MSLPKENGGYHTEIRGLAELRSVRIPLRSKIKPARALRAHLPSAHADRSVRFNHPLAGVPCRRPASVDGVKAVHTQRNGDAIWRRIANPDFVFGAFNGLHIALA